MREKRECLRDWQLQRHWECWFSFGGLAISYPSLPLRMDLPTFIETLFSDCADKYGLVSYFARFFLILSSFRLWFPVGFGNEIISLRWIVSVSIFSYISSQNSSGNIHSIFCVFRDLISLSTLLLTSAIVRSLHTFCLFDDRLRWWHHSLDFLSSFLPSDFHFLSASSSLDWLSVHRWEELVSVCACWHVCV